MPTQSDSRSNVDYVLALLRQEVEPPSVEWMRDTLWRFPGLRPMSRDFYLGIITNADSTDEARDDALTWLAWLDKIEREDAERCERIEKLKRWLAETPLPPLTAEMRADPGVQRNLAMIAHYKRIIFGVTAQPRPMRLRSAPRRLRSVRRAGTRRARAPARPDDPEPLPALSRLLLFLRTRLAGSRETLDQTEAS